MCMCFPEDWLRKDGGAAPQDAEPSGLPRIEFRTASGPIKETPRVGTIALKQLMVELGLAELAEDLDMNKHHGLATEHLLCLLLLYARYGARSISDLEEHAQKDQALAEIMEDVEKLNTKVLLYFEGRNSQPQLRELLNRAVARAQDNPRFRSQTSGVLIVDDSPLCKSGKKMEKIEIIFDHATRTYTLGYILVTVAYADHQKAYPVNFEFRLLSDEERQDAERERQKQQAGIDLRKRGSRLQLVELQERKGTTPDSVEVTGVNLDASTLATLDQKQIPWIALPSKKTPLCTKNDARGKLEELEAKAAKNKPWLLEVDGWLVYRKAVRLKEYGPVDLVVVTDTQHQPLGTFLTKPTSLPKDTTTLIQRYFQAREPADSNKLTIALKSLARAKQARIQAETVAVDAWYFVPWFVLKVLLLLGIRRLVSRLKSNYRVCYQGEWMEAKELWDRLKLRAVPGRPMRKASVLVGIKSLPDPVRLVFLQELTKSLRVRAQYILVCTDSQWSWEKIVETYKLRWSIEVFFRMAKQRSGLEAFHVRKFDKIFCHVTFSFLSYLLCAHLKCCNPRLQHLTMGQILDRYLRGLIERRREGPKLVVYLDPEFEETFGSPFDTS